jgi:hypothetical protein
MVPIPAIFAFGRNVGHKNFKKSEVLCFVADQREKGRIERPFCCAAVVLLFAG